MPEVGVSTASRPAFVTGTACAIGAFLGGLAIAGPGLANEVSVPSGQPVTLAEIVTEDQDGAAWLRYRFVAPELKTGGFAVAEADMLSLCETLAVPDAQARGTVPAGIIISLSDRTVAFGQAAPDATQFFEAYMLIGEKCLPEIL